MSVNSWEIIPNLSLLHRILNRKKKFTDILFPVESVDKETYPLDSKCYVIHNIHSGDLHSCSYITETPIYQALEKIYYDLSIEDFKIRFKSFTGDIKVQSMTREQISAGSTKNCCINLGHRRQQNISLQNRDFITIGFKQPSIPYIFRKINVSLVGSYESGFIMIKPDPSNENSENDDGIKNTNLVTEVVPIFLDENKNYESFNKMSKNGCLSLKFERKSQYNDPAFINYCIDNHLNVLDLAKWALLLFNESAQLQKEPQQQSLAQNITQRNKMAHGQSETSHRTSTHQDLSYSFYLFFCDLLTKHLNLQIKLFLIGNKNINEDIKMIFQCFNEIIIPYHTIYHEKNDKMKGTIELDFTLSNFLHNIKLDLTKLLVFIEERPSAVSFDTICMIYWLGKVIHLIGGPFAGQNAALKEESASIHQTIDSTMCNKDVEFFSKQSSLKEEHVQNETDLIEMSELNVKDEITEKFQCNRITSDKTGSGDKYSQIKIFPKSLLNYISDLKVIYTKTFLESEKDKILEYTQNNEQNLILDVKRITQYGRTESPASQNHFHGKKLNTFGKIHITVHSYLLDQSLFCLFLSNMINCKFSEIFKRCFRQKSAKSYKTVISMKKKIFRKTSKKPEDLELKKTDGKIQFKEFNFGNIYELRQSKQDYFIKNTSKFISRSNDIFNDIFGLEMNINQSSLNKHFSSNSNKISASAPYMKDNELFMNGRAILDGFLGVESQKNDSDEPYLYVTDVPLVSSIFSTFYKLHHPPISIQITYHQSSDDFLILRKDSRPDHRECLEQKKTFCDEECRSAAISKFFSIFLHLFKQTHIIWKFNNQNYDEKLGDKSNDVHIVKTEKENLNNSDGSKQELPNIAMYRKGIAVVDYSIENSTDSHLCDIAKKILLYSQSNTMVLTFLPFVDIFFDSTHRQFCISQIHRVIERKVVENLKKWIEETPLSFDASNPTEDLVSSSDITLAEECDWKTPILTQIKFYLDEREKSFQGGQSPSLDSDGSGLDDSEVQSKNQQSQSIFEFSQTEISLEETKHFPSIQSDLVKSAMIKFLLKSGENYKFVGIADRGLLDLTLNSDYGDQKFLSENILSIYDIYKLFVFRLIDYDIEIVSEYV